jgi:hypothetical protein
MSAAPPVPSQVSVTTRSTQHTAEAQTVDA